MAMPPISRRELHALRDRVAALEAAATAHDHAGGDGAQIDHGGLAGLGDDDHTIYGLQAVAAQVIDVAAGFTNTTAADLDALSVDPLSGPVAVTVTTGARALVVVSSSQMRINTSGACLLGYRVSGASTIASNVNRAARTDSTVDASNTFVDVQEGLTPGSNTFELQAWVTANSGVVRNPSLAVIPLR